MSPNSPADIQEAETGHVAWPEWLKRTLSYTMAVVVVIFATTGWLDSNYAKRSDVERLQIQLTPMQVDLKTLVSNQPTLSSQVSIVEAKHSATLEALQRIERSQEKLERRIDSLYTKVTEKL